MVDDLDRLLSGHEDLIPSSGFTRSVMDAVRHAAVEPPPIPFPWTRALPGLCAAGVSLGLIVTSSIRVFRGPAMPPLPAAGMAALETIAHATTSPEAQWLALTLVLTVMAVTLPQRLDGWFRGR